VRAEGSVAQIVLYTNYRSAQLAQQAGRLGAAIVTKGPLPSLREALVRLLS
jgi:hypothetical protein